MNAHKTSVTMEMELGSTRALACSDRRPRRSEEDVVPSLIRIFHAHFDANVRSACSAGFQACCVADFQVGRMSDAAGRQRVWKPAIQQTWKSAPRGQADADHGTRGTVG